jgi:hypothetical protein
MLSSLSDGRFARPFASEVSNFLCLSGILAVSAGKSTIPLISRRERCGRASTAALWCRIVPHSDLSDPPSPINQCAYFRPVMYAPPIEKFSTIPSRHK